MSYYEKGQRLRVKCGRGQRHGVVTRAGRGIEDDLPVIDYACYITWIASQRQWTKHSAPLYERDVITTTGERSEPSDE
jgi:hypothetical protein